MLTNFYTVTISNLCAIYFGGNHTTLRFSGLDPVEIAHRAKAHVERLGDLIDPQNCTIQWNVSTIQSIGDGFTAVDGKDDYLCEFGTEVRLDKWMAEGCQAFTTRVVDGEGNRIGQ